jgi:hypothetical protein
MTSASGFNNRDTDYARQIQEVLDELRQMQQPPQLVTSPAELEAFEREIRQRTDRLGSSHSIEFSGSPLDLRC